MRRGWVVVSLLGASVVVPSAGLRAAPQPAPAGLSVSHWATGTVLSFRPAGTAKAYTATRHDPARPALTVACNIPQASSAFVACATGVPTYQGDTWTLAVAGGTPAPPGSPASRSMWVDDVHPSSGNTAGWVFPAPPATIVATAVANGTTDLFMAVPHGALTTQAAKYAALLTAAAPAHIRVAALSGDPSWASDGGTGVTEFVDAVIAYNSAHPADPFAGVHLDIEPWAAPDWSTNQPALISGYLTALQQARVLAHGAGLAVEADITTWLNTLTAPGSDQSLDRDVEASVDRVTIMSYQSSAAAQFAAAEPELSDLAPSGPVRLAADTVVGDPGRYGGICDADWMQLAALDGLVASSGVAPSQYLGIALFDFTGVVALGRGAPAQVTLSTAPATSGRTAVTVKVDGASGSATGEVSLYQTGKFLTGGLLGAAGSVTFIRPLSSVSGLTARYGGDVVYAPATG